MSHMRVMRVRAAAEAAGRDGDLPARASEVPWAFGHLALADRAPDAFATGIEDPPEETTSRAPGSPGEGQRPTIVCGVDNSAEARRALETAIELARRIDVRPLIVRVGQAPMMRDTESSELIAWAAKSNPPDDAEYKVVYGLPAESLVDAAREVGATLIVVGSRARGRIATALRGSASADVIAQATCPVLVVPAAHG